MAVNTPVSEKDPVATPNALEVQPPKADPTKPGGGIKLMVWRFFGALFMEPKKNNGVTIQAISHHKTLGLVLFVIVVSIWTFGGTHFSNEEIMKLVEAGKDIPSKWGVPPDMMVYTLWSLIGLKGVSKVSSLFGGN